MAMEILCKFTGGPQGDETLKIHQFHCLEKVSLEINWVKPSSDGRAVILKGERPRNTE
jgi:hypothetical protein